MIDIGLNLSHESFQSDRDEVISRALEAGVKHFILTGATLQGSQDAFHLTQEYPDYFFSTAGVHPHYSSEYSDEAHASLQALCEHKKVVAVGECGLDFNRNFSSHTDQENAFHSQLQIAKATQLPVFLHQRDAHDHFLAILNEHIHSISGGVAHCFTGNKNEMREYLDLGLYIGITGWICDERRGHDLQEAINFLPADRMLIETDAPYLLPRDLKPKPKSRRNEPMHLPHILEVIARIRNEEAEYLADITTQNAMTLFDLSL